MLLDVFKDSAFEMTSLTKAINLVPFMPTRLGRLGVFSQEPITTTAVAVEMQGETLALVASKPRGSAPTPVVPVRRSLRNLSTVHLPVGVTVLADEVQNLRAFGTDSEPATALAWLQRKMAVARRRIDLTLEYQRVGAIKGQILDSDGSTVLMDLFTEFGVAQQTLSMVLGTAGTKVLQKVVTLKRMVEDELGGVPYSQLRVECSPEFFDAFTGHTAVETAYKDWMQGRFLREDNRNGFDFGGVIWEEYRGKVGSNQFIEAGSAYVVPEGVPDLFTQHYAPAPYNETVNTMGMPIYAKMEEMGMGKGYDVEMQSNPLTFCTRPRALVKLTVA